MAAPATSRAERIAALAAYPADDARRPTDDALFDLRVVDGLCSHLQAGLATIDADPAMSGVDQLATLAVAAVRALTPLLAAEADDQVAKAEARAAARAGAR